MKGTFLSQIALDQTFFLDINYLFRSRKIRIQSKISGKNGKERVGRALNKVNSIAATKQRGYFSKELVFCTESSKLK